MSRPTTPEQADLRDVEAFAAALPTKYLVCRDIRHSWRPFDAELRRHEAKQVFRCSRCRCELHRTLSRSTGAVLDRKMKYPDGYLREKGAGRIGSEGNNLLRIEALHRDLKGA